MSNEPTLNSDSVPKGIPIEVRWGDFENLSTIYANNLFIVHTETQFYLVFGELLTPLIVDIEKEKDRLPKTLTVKPVARIAVSPTVMKKFVDAITENYKKFITKQEIEEEESK